MDRLIEEMTVDNRVIQVTHDYVPIDKIELDYENPRLKYRLAKNLNGKKPTEKQLEDEILALPEVKDLLRDIQHSGGLHDRVILQKNGHGKYKAVEGNCRTTCVRELRTKHPEDERWKKVPARILPADADDRIKARLLTSYHVAGKIQWKAHEKAAYCYHMFHDLKIKQEDIAIAMHASKGTVGRFITAYGFFVNSFLRLYPKAGEGKWSYFEEFFKKKELRDALEKNPDFGERFCQWVGDGRLEKGADVRFLPVLLTHPDALKVFEESDKDVALAKAKKLIEKDEPEQGSDFFKQLGKMRQDLTSAAQVKEILRIRTDKIARQRLLDTYQAMVDFMRLADVEIPQTETE
jgi:hypothetical protein